MKISASQIKQFCNCPYHWYFTKKKGIKEYSNLNFTWGKSLHEGLRYFYSNPDLKKLTSDKKAKETVGVITNVFDAFIEEEAAIMSAETKNSVKDEKESLLECSNFTLEKFFDTESYIPLVFENKQCIEHFFEIPLPKVGEEEVVLTGYIDLIDSDGSPIEWKSSRTRIGNEKDSVSEIERKLLESYFWQSVLYPLAVEKTMGVMSNKMDFQLFLKRKRDYAAPQKIIINNPLQRKEQAGRTIKKIVENMVRMEEPSEQDLIFCSYCGQKHNYII